MAYIRFADAQDCIEHNSANLNFLEDQLVSIQSKLNAKRLEEQSLRVAIEDSYDFLALAPQLHLGLGIRSLNKHLLAVVLGYLDLNGGANMVCRYWSLLMVKNRKSIQSGPEVVYREKPTKRSIELTVQQLKSAFEAKKLIQQESASSATYPPSPSNKGFDSHSATMIPPSHTSHAETSNHSSHSLSPNKNAASNHIDELKDGALLTSPPLTTEDKDTQQGTVGVVEVAAVTPRKSKASPARSKNAAEIIQLSDDSDMDEENGDTVDVALTNMMGRLDKQPSNELSTTSPRHKEHRSKNSDNSLLNTKADLATTIPIPPQSLSSQHQTLSPSPRYNANHPKPPNYDSELSLFTPTHSKHGAPAPVSVSFDNILKSKLADGTNPTYYTPKLAQLQATTSPRVALLTGADRNRTKDGNLQASIDTNETNFSESNRSDGLKGLAGDSTHAVNDEQLSKQQPQQKQTQLHQTKEEEAPHIPTYAETLRVNFNNGKSNSFIQDAAPEVHSQNSSRNTAVPHQHLLTISEVLLGAKSKLLEEPSHQLDGNLIKDKLSPKSHSDALVATNDINNAKQHSFPSRQLSTGTGPELPAVAESKSSSRKPTHASGKARNSSRRHNRRENSRENKEHLLLHVKDIRSQQHMNATIDFVQSGMDKIEALNRDKRRVKKMIRAWNASYEKTNGVAPIGSERKGLVRDLYEEYQQISLALKVRNDKMDSTLKSIGIDREGFLKLRDRRDNT